MTAAAVWILTGLSGAGKATALRALESAGIACTDNLPLELVAAFAARSRDTAAAAVVDARQGAAVGDLELPDGVCVLFLDARDDVLVHRIAESTRPHPCAGAGGGQAAIDAERAMLHGLRARADVIVDTTELQPADLSARVRELVLPAATPPAPLQVTVSSFGFKFGAQREADWVIDARMIRNPFWVPELRPLTGLDERVRDYVLADDTATELLSRLTDLLTWASGRYAQHRRRHLHIAVGCTGGRHRSVVLAEALARALEPAGVDVRVRHRDVSKPDPR